MNWKMRSIVLLIGLPMLGVCATAFYFLYKKEDDDLEEALQSVKSSRLNIVEIKIPKANVGVIIGRAGNTIRDIQEQSNTKINFKGEEHEDMRTCVIRGTVDGVQIAETMIRELIMNQPLIETFEMYVPQRACGRIIGRCGDNIRAISRVSNAKINIDSSGNKNEDKRVLIKGTIEQISVAKSLIQEKVQEDIEVRQKMELSQANRSPRNKPSTPTSILESPAHSKNDTYDTGSLEPMLATGSDGRLEVFVSAVNSPSNFWVQVLSPRSVELDRLVEEMTTYYSLEENKEIHRIKKLTIGQIVAAPFNFDTKWYRAEVKKIEVNDSDPNENKVDLYYVDYGDSEYRKQSELLQLRTDFLTLRFQAIECNLSNVKPSGSTEDWSEASIDCFEELCHVAQWKPLMARVVTFKEKQRGHREGSPVPCLDLYDTCETEDFNIGDQLVNLGFALYIEENKDTKNYVNGDSNDSQKCVNGTNNEPVHSNTNNVFYRPAGESDSEVESDEFIFDTYFCN